MNELKHYQFRNLDLYTKALTHSSFANEIKDQVETNERLEFIGDSILNFYVALKLYHLYPELSEGKLSQMRSFLVNEESLSKIALFLNLQDQILLGKGAARLGESLRPSVLADTFEAVLAAIFLDGGEEAAKMWLDKILIEYNEDFFGEDLILEFDPKSKLQEIVMKKYNSIPVYKAVESKNSFEVTLYINGKVISSLTDTSKKKAEKKLAQVYLSSNQY